MKYRLKTKKKFGLRRRLIAGGFAVVLITSILLLAVKPPPAAADIAFISQSTGLAATAVASLSVTAPAGIATGNVMIAQTMALPSQSNSVTTTAPAGWVKIGVAVTGNKYSMTEFYKVATASEPASYTFSFTPTATAAIGISAFSSVDTKAPVDVQASQTNASSTSQIAPSVSATYNTDMILPLWGYESNTIANSIPAGVTRLYNTSTTNNGIQAGAKLLTNSGATGTFTGTTAAATGSLGHTIGLKPATAAAGVQFVAATAPNTTCASCTSMSEAAPAGWKGGDFLLTSVTWNTNSSTLTAPSGWTLIDTTQTTGAFAMAEYYHFAVTGDPSSYTWNFSAATANAMVSTVDFQGVDAAQPIDVTASGLSPSGTSDSSPSVTTNYAQDMLVDIWGWNTGTNATTITSTMTKFWDAKTGNAAANDSAAAGYELLGLAGSSGTRTVTSGRTAIAMMHSIALKAFLPTPTLISQVSGTTGSTLFPVYKLVNASLTSSPLKYKIQLCSTSTCSSIITTYDQTISQTGWSGQDASAGTAYFGSTDSSLSTTATYTTQTALSVGTQYWWRGISFDTGASQLSNPSNIYTFTTSFIPAAPTLFSPGANASGIPLQPEFRLASTDADADYLQYKIQLCSNSSCTAIIQTFDQTASQVNWSGQDANGNTAYQSDAVTSSNSTLGYFNFTSGTLIPNTQYWWRAYAIDPAGTNNFSPASTIQSFTTNIAQTKIIEGRILGSIIL